MKEKRSTEMGRAQSDSTSLTLACRNGLGGGREREVLLSGGRAVIAEWDDRAQGRRKRLRGRQHLGSAQEADVITGASEVEYSR